MQDVIVAIPQGIRASGLVAELTDLNWNVLVPSPTRKALLELAEERTARIIILDDSFAGGETKSLIRALHRVHPKLRVLLWCDKLRTAIQYQLNKSDIHGYFINEASVAEVNRGCRLANSGKSYVPLAINQAVKRYRKNVSQHPVLSGLTNREGEIFQLVTTGMSVSQIAKDLFISRKTVNTFRYRLHKKLNVSCDVQLAHIAIKYGLIEAGIDGDDAILLA
ncbi:MAG: response regulator transcription factor [Gammaproteobacteria bacterium]|nr:response regulator transcription factor [Gammaproteobacteria bacterium]